MSFINSHRHRRRFACIYLFVVFISLVCFSDIKANKNDDKKTSVAKDNSLENESISGIFQKLHGLVGYEKKRKIKKKWIPKETDQDQIQSWAMPSRLTDSGMPPIVIKIPMQEKELQAKKPKIYLDRVKNIVEKAGFKWISLAVPTVFKEYHLIHADADIVSALFIKAGIDDFASKMPPKRPKHLRYSQQKKRDDQIMQKMMKKGNSKEISRNHHQRPSPPPPPIYEDIIRSLNLRASLHKKWTNDWNIWADKEVHHYETDDDNDKSPWKQRLIMAAAMRKALMEDSSSSNGQISYVKSQHPQTRSLRIGRQPHVWQHYRERWDIDSHANDHRGARSLDNDPRKKPVNDPMLTEEWSLYDAATWGDLPEGIYVHRPNLNAGPQVWDVLGIDGKGVGIGVVDTGIELTHPELIHRYLRATSYDALNPHRNRPPLPVDPWQETHGTQAAGVALAQRGNQVCGAGVAPEARLGAIRLLGLRSPTDSEEASAISHACRSHSGSSQAAMINHVYSCSWGPVDDAADLRGPNVLTAKALEACVHDVGRHGKGSIYVWAAGNGRSSGDNANFDGYANRPETIAVGAIDDMGRQSWYSEACACLLVVAPSSGGSSGIVTSDPSGPAGLSQGRCTRNFGGTSAAAPAIAGVVALMLQATPDLGWRDVQHILVQTSSQIQKNERREPWTLNAAGHWHSHGYGFGLVNATKAVLLSLAWKSVKSVINYKSPILESIETWNQQTNNSLNEPRRFESSWSMDDHDQEEEEEEETLKTKITQEDMENPFKTVALFTTRFLGKGFRYFAEKIRIISRQKRKATKYANRELEPNRVRIITIKKKKHHHHHHDDDDDISTSSSTGVAIPPGMSAHFEWNWPEKNKIHFLEHVGLQLDVSTPSGRGLLRIWLCSPSGTCSLMAPAPHQQDGHFGIQGSAWTFWTVRHWDEHPRYATDHTGHGSSTWSLRLTHVLGKIPKMANDLEKLRIKHPERVDVVLHWWKIRAYGT